jgi:hypothetical protein
MSFQKLTKGWQGIASGLWIFRIFNQKQKEDISEPEPMKAPSVEEGVNIPVLFGSRMIKNPMIAWWGDVNIIKVDAPSGGGKKG